MEEELKALKERIDRARTLIEKLRSANRALSAKLSEVQRGPDTQKLDDGSDAGHPKRASRKRTEPASASDPLLESRLELLLRERKQVRDKIEKLLERLEGV